MVDPMPVLTPAAMSTLPTRVPTAPPLMPQFTSVLTWSAGDPGAATVKVLSWKNCTNGAMGLLFQGSVMMIQTWGETAGRVPWSLTIAVVNDSIVPQIRKATIARCGSLCCNPSRQESKARGMVCVQSQSGLHSQLHVSHRTCLSCRLGTGSVDATW